MRLTAALAAAVALLFTSTVSASAHFLRHGHMKTTSERVAYFTRSVAHDRAQVHRDQRLLVRLLSQRSGVETIAVARPLVQVVSYRARWHRHAFRWHRAQLHRYTVRLEAERLAALVPAHVRGWSCITNGAYPTAPHEGNGYNDLYTGPLGMTTPWMGHMPPGSDWVHSDVMAVYMIAERESAAQGFSYAWMKGQWPNTYPPCAGLF